MLTGKARGRKLLSRKNLIFLSIGLKSEVLFLSLSLSPSRVCSSPFLQRMDVSARRRKRMEMQRNSNAKISVRVPAASVYSHVRPHGVFTLLCPDVRVQRRLEATNIARHRLVSLRCTHFWLFFLRGPRSLFVHTLSCELEPCTL